MKSTPIQLYVKKVIKESKIHKEILHQLEVVLLAKQKKCKHKNIIFCPDASGNNDNYYECINCGKEL